MVIWTREVVFSLIYFIIYCYNNEPSPSIYSSPFYSLEDLKIRSNKMDPFDLAAKDISSISSGIKELLGSDHPVLESCARYFFDNDGGKKIRPTMVLNMSYALNYNTKTVQKHADNRIDHIGTPVPELFASHSQKRLAEITEMIHTASLFHDDVIDKV